MRVVGFTLRAKGIVAALSALIAFVAQPANACRLPVGYTPPPPEQVAERFIATSDIVARGIVTVREDITVDDLIGQRVEIAVTESMQGDLTGSVRLEGPISFGSCGGQSIGETYFYGLTRGGEVVMVGEARADGPAILHIYPVETPVGAAILNSLQSSTQ